MSELKDLIAVLNRVDAAFGPWAEQALERLVRKHKEQYSKPVKGVVLCGKGSGLVHRVIGVDRDGTFVTYAEGKQQRRSAADWSNFYVLPGSEET